MERLPAVSRGDSIRRKNFSLASRGNETKFQKRRWGCKLRETGQQGVGLSVRIPRDGTREGGFRRPLSVVRHSSGSFARIINTELVEISRMGSSRGKNTRRAKKGWAKERDAAISQTRSSSIYNEISSNIFIAVTRAALSPDAGESRANVPPAVIPTLGKL